MSDDPRDHAAAQDRAARLAALGSRADILSRLTSDDDDERRVVGYYRGQPIYES